MKKTYIKPNIVAVNMQELCDDAPGIVVGSNASRGTTDDPDLSKGHNSWGWDDWGSDDEVPTQKSLWDE